MALPHVLGVDLGGTNIRVAVLDANGSIGHASRTKTLSEQGPEAVIDRIADLIAAVAAEAGIGADIPVGIASPGPLNPRTGVVHYTPNLPGWRDVPVVTKLEQLTGRRVALANDGNCAALGELRFGSARGCKNLVYLALGTGIGGGVVTEGVLIDGKNGLGAEIGHTLVSIDGPRCTCGSIGCLEAYASGWAIQAEAMKVATTADGDRLRELATDGHIHAGVVATAAAEGHQASIAILERAGRALGASIGSFINMFDPEMIVIGGGVATLGEALMGPARKMIPQYSFVDMRRDVPVVYSSLGGDTGLYGAGALAFMTFD
ncbi:MAG: ROK family protein [Thermomicrobiales bacterium]|nr:ROK family protein [Thermomicrobiales bacterium]